MRSAFKMLPCILLLAVNTAFAQAYVTRHAMSLAGFQTEFDKWVKEGYRLTCLSGYTNGGKESYAAMWEKTGGPAWQAFAGMTSDQYQVKVNDLGKTGFRPVYISAYNVGGTAKFAAIWQQSNAAWLARHNMTADQYQQAFNDFKNQGYRLKQVCGYAIGATPYFAALWEKSDGPAWEARHNLTAAQYQQAFEDMNRKGFVVQMVSGYSVNGTDLYAAVWEKTATPLYFTRHAIPLANYQNVVDNMYYQGYRPEFINAFSSGSSSKFNAIWTNTNMKGADLGKIDNAVNGYMQSQGVTGLSLAICKNGRLVFAKGYGYANGSTGEEMSPGDPLRIMSISKSVTSVGVMTLVQQGKLSLDKHVFGPNSVLGAKYTTPSGKTKLNNITVRQLLNHTSGLRTCNGESVFWDASKTPKDAMDVLLVAGNLITTDTGSQYIYSNTNYFFLSRVIEEVSGQSYETYVRNNVLIPCGVGNTMYLGKDNGEARPGEGTYKPYDKMNLQLWSGFGGWVARPMDLLKILNRCDGNAAPPDILNVTTHTAMTTGSKLSAGYGLGWVLTNDLQAHNGCYGASRSFLVELGGGISYAVIINSAPANDGCGWTLKGAIEAGLSGVSGYPSYDLF